MKRVYEVLVGNTSAGFLEENTNGVGEFRLTASYLAAPDRPVLGQIFEDNPEKVFRENRDPLPRWFANLLPESDSRLRRYLLAARGLELQDEWGLLGALGRDLPGAVEVRPFGDVTENNSASAGDAALSSASETPREAAAGLRFSLAGVQLKFSVIASGDRIALPAKDGLGTYILKVAGMQWPGLAANEAAMMFWAREAGFDVADARVVPLPDLDLPRDWFADAQPEALLVKRFDRRPEGRVHQEDLAQVTNRAPADKYQSKFESLALLIRSILGDAGFEEYLRRLTLMVAQGNSDAHLKNWSIRYADPRVPLWSPIYDQVCTLAYPGIQTDLAMKMAGVRNLRAVTLDSFKQVASKAGYPEGRAVQLVIEVIDRLRAAWSHVLDRQPLPKGHREVLVEHWRRALLTRDLVPLENTVAKAR